MGEGYFRRSEGDIFPLMYSFYVPFKLHTLLNTTESYSCLFIVVLIYSNSFFVFFLLI